MLKDTTSSCSSNVTKEFYINIVDLASNNIYIYIYAKMSAIGIDLGTTYSCVATLRNGKIEIIANDDGNRVTPSYVSFNEEQRLVGDAAKQQISRNAENTLYQIKRLIGCKYKDEAVQRDLERWSFQVVEDKNTPKLMVNYKKERRFFRPEEVSAMVLTSMKETAEVFIGTKVTDAVITVPAYFNDAQRKATKDAGTIAGLNVIGMINEPTAAALAYGLERKTTGEKIVLIFDLGGGTFDVTVMKIEGSNFDVQATGGDTHLGGEDFTNALYEYFSAEFNGKNDVDITKNLRSVTRLRTECERAKRVLSNSTSDNMHVDALYGGLDLTSSITRSKFEMLNDELFHKTIETVKNTIKNSGLSKDQIDDIVLVGGSTRIPKIRALLKEYFEKDLLRTINADEAVAYGAAVQAALLSDDVSSLIKDVKLHDVAPLSLGIETRYSVMSVVIPRNTKIPTKKYDTFVTGYDNQTSAPFRVYEGERVCTDENRHLGTFYVENLSPLPKGEVELRVCFEVDKAGILTVTACDEATEKKNHIVIEDRGNLSQEEVKQLIENAEKYKKDDDDYRKRSKLMNELEDLAYNSKKTIDQQVEKGNIKDDAEKEKMIDECEKVMNWLKVNQKESLETYQSQYANLKSSWEKFKLSHGDQQQTSTGSISVEEYDHDYEILKDMWKEFVLNQPNQTGAGGIPERDGDDPNTPKPKKRKSKQKASMSRLLNFTAKVKDDIKTFSDNGELMKYCRKLENWHKKGEDSISAKEYDREYEILEDMWKKFVLGQPNQTGAGGIPERDEDDPNTPRPKIKATKKVTEQSIQGKLEPGAAVLKSISHIKQISEQKNLAKAQNKKPQMAFFIDEEGEVRKTDPYFMPDSDSTDTSKAANTGGRAASSGSSLMKGAGKRPTSSKSKTKKEALEEDRKYVIEYENKFFEKNEKRLPRKDKIKIMKAFEDVKQWLNINPDCRIKNKREAKIQELEEYCDSFFTSQTTSL